MTMYFRDEGEGTPIVLLHGLGASGRVFDALFEKRAQRRLITVDLPRTARSGHWAQSTPEHVASALLEWLTTRGVTRFELFGHSFGGCVALVLAARAPERIERLTVASTPAMGVPTELKLLLHAPATDFAFGFMNSFPIWKPALRAYLQMIWGPRSSLSDAHLDLYAEALRAPGFRDGMLEALRAVSNFTLPFDTLSKAGFPKHVLWGEKDPLVNVVQGEQLARAIGGRLVVLPFVGHCVPEEAPDALHELLLAAG